MDCLCTTSSYSTASAEFVNIDEALIDLSNGAAITYGTSPTQGHSDAQLSLAAPVQLKGTIFLTILLYFILLVPIPPFFMFL
jgi:hypothetical protein